MRVLKAILVALVLSVGLAAPVAAGPMEDAAAAYKRGDYATVLQLVRPLAEQGLAHAQSSPPNTMNAFPASGAPRAWADAC